MNHHTRKVSVCARPHVVKKLFSQSARIGALLLCLALSNLTTTASATATTITVGNAGDHPIGNAANCNVASTCTLRDAIAKAANVTGSATGDTIEFSLPANSTITLSSGGRALVVNKSLTIDGSGSTGLTISGGNSCGVLQIQSSTTVALIQLIITKGSSFGNNRSGGIFNDGNLRLIQSKVSDNHGVGTDYAANGIYNTGTLTLINSAVTNNSGIGIFSSGTMILTASTISGNADYGISNTGIATLTESTISNTARFGGISNINTMTLFTSTISDNHGGGISNTGNLTLTDTTVSGNTSSSGGGINNGHSGNLVLINSIVTDNVASGNFSHAGGIYNAGMLALTNCTIKNNTATYGGGIESNGTLIMDSSIILNNTASEGGGIWNSGELTLTDSAISSNSAGYAGGIENHGTLAVIGSTVLNNMAIDGSCGGIDNSGITRASVLTLTGSTVSGNTSRNGAICNIYGALTLINSTVVNNEAIGKSGGIYASVDFYDHGGTLTLIGSTIAGNTAAGVANDIYNGQRSDSTAINTVIRNCTLDGDDTTTLTDNGGNLDGGNGCGFTSANSKSNATLDLGALADNGGPTLTMMPGPNSDAIGFGLPDVCRNAPVNSRDERGYVRPPVGCTSGAVDPNASANDSIFFDGFAFGGW